MFGRPKPLKVEIYPTDLNVNMLFMDPVERGIYCTLVFRMLRDAEPVKIKHLKTICAAPQKKTEKIVFRLAQLGYVDVVNESVVIPWCIEASLRASARPPQEEWKRLRDQVFERDDYTCRYCGKRGGTLECDHVTPAAKGGQATLDNLVTSCKPCNRKKRDRTPEEAGYVQ